MLHRTSPLQWLLATLLITTLFACRNPPASLAGESGFTEAFFGSEELGAVMSDPKCTDLRFYNARRERDDVNGTAIIVGVRNDGTEIQKETSTDYLMYDELSESTVRSKDLNQGDARRGCRYVTDARERSYAADFKAEMISEILSMEGCNGVKIAPKWLEDRECWSMEIWPVQIHEGRAEVIEPYEPMMCTEPCPLVCGNTANYIHL